MAKFNYFTTFECSLWFFSIATILSSYLFFHQSNLLALSASLIGASALIFLAKANPLGQGLFLVFSVLYAYISLKNHYFGEVLVYFTMTLPMDILALSSWLSHPFMGRKSQVLISHLSIKDIYLVSFLSFLVTVIFYFVLGIFHTSFLLISTLSITTTFAATFLSYKRSPYFALIFAINDIVLIILWLLEANTISSHFSVAICYAVFLMNDIYTFFNWIRLHSHQENIIKKDRV